MSRIVRLIKKIPSFVQQKINPIGYAKKQGMHVGKGCIIESFNFGTEPYLITIGDHVEITTDVTFITHDGATWVFRNDLRYKNIIRYGRIIIHDNVFLGHGTILLPDIEIGENTVIGAGSVVAQDIPANSVAAGNPARVLSAYEAYAEKCLRENPEYDISAYKKEKTTEIIRCLNLKAEKDEK